MGIVIRASHFPHQEAMLYVPEHLVDTERLENELTVPNAAYMQAMRLGLPTGQLASQLVLYEKTAHGYRVPRHYPVPWTGTPPKIVHTWGKAGGNYPRQLFEDNITFRSEIQKAACEALSFNFEDKILNLSCGIGKTVVSIAAFNRGERYPVLIVVNTEPLLAQWKRELLDKTSLKEEQIGHVQGAKCKWKGKAVVIAMLHTLWRRDWPKEFTDYFNLVVFDEAHRLGAEKFSRVCAMFPCERWGLTATVERDDGMTKVFRHHLGKVAYSYLQQALTPQVYFVNTKIGKDMSKFTYRGRFMQPLLVNAYAEDEGRDGLILSYIYRAVQKGRTVLVLGERIEQLKQLHANIDTPSKSLVLGTIKGAAREKALQAQVVFASQQIAKEGLDKPLADTLLILWPFGGKGRLTQSIGRILRLHPDKGQPVVLIFRDSNPVSFALCKKMMNNLTNAGWGYKLVDAQVTQT